MVCSGALSKSFELVEDVELVAAFSTYDANGRWDEGGEHRPVIADTVAGVEIRKTCCGSRNSKGESCAVLTLLFIMAYANLTITCHCCSVWNNRVCNENLGYHSIHKKEQKCARTEISEQRRCEQNKKTTTYADVELQLNNGQGQ